MTVFYVTLAAIHKFDRPVQADAIENCCISHSVTPGKDEIIYCSAFITF